MMTMTTTTTSACKKSTKATRLSIHANVGIIKKGLH